MSPLIGKGIPLSSAIIFSSPESSRYLLYWSSRWFHVWYSRHQWPIIYEIHLCVRDILVYELFTANSQESCGANKTNAFCCLFNCCTLYGSTVTVIGNIHQSACTAYIIYYWCNFDMFLRAINHCWIWRFTERNKEWMLQWLLFANVERHCQRLVHKCRGLHEFSLNHFWNLSTEEHQKIIWFVSLLYVQWLKPISSLKYNRK